MLVLHQPQMVHLSALQHRRRRKTADWYAARYRITSRWDHGMEILVPTATMDSGYRKRYTKGSKTESSAGEIIYVHRNVASGWLVEGKLVGSQMKIPVDSCWPRTRQCRPELSCASAPLSRARGRGKMKINGGKTKAPGGVGVAHARPAGARWLV